METPNQVYLAIKRSYWYGFFSYMGINMLIQDYLGLEKYLVFVRENWVDIPWVVGLVIAAMGIMLRVAMIDRFNWLEAELWSEVMKSKLAEWRRINGRS